MLAQPINMQNFYYGLANQSVFKADSQAWNVLY